MAIGAYQEAFPFKALVRIGEPDYYLAMPPQSLRGIPTKAVGFTLLFSGQAYLIVKSA